MTNKKTNLDVLEELDVEHLGDLKKELSITGRIVERIVSLVQKIIYLAPELSLLLVSADVIRNSNMDISKLSSENYPSFVWDFFLENIEALTQLLLLSILIFCVGFIKRALSRAAKKIEKRLENKLESCIDQFTDAIEEFLETIWWNILRQPVKQYYDFMASENEYFEPPGSANLDFPFSLQDTFVNLNINWRIESKKGNKGTSHNPIDLSERPEIWDFLALGRIDSKFRNIVLLGEPGSGKSTLLRYLAVVYAQKTYKKISQVSRKAPKLIPILLPIREIADEILLRKKNICQAALGTLESLEVTKSERFSKWLEGRLKRGKCLVMIDGLDEVAEKGDRKQVNRWVKQVIDRYPKNYYLITSRHFGHDDSILKDVVILEVRELDLRYAEDFIHKWYLNKERMTRAVSAFRKKHRRNQNIFWPQGSRARQAIGEEAAAQKNAGISAGSLISKIRSHSSLARMAVNPLSLSMMVIVHSRGRQLPDSRSELYRVICDSLLSSREGEGLSIQPNKSPEDSGLKLSKAQNFAVLQSLSLNLMKANSIEFSSQEISEMIVRKISELTGEEIGKPDVFLEHIRKSSGLIVESSLGRNQFSHRCIQEYLAASQIQELGEEDFLIEKINEDWWNETIRIYAATSVMADSAKRIVRTAVDKFVERPEKNALAFKLAYDCLEECDNRLPKTLKAKLHSLLNRNLESENAILRKYSAEVKLLQRFSNNFMGLTPSQELDRKYLIHSEYQLFIDSMLLFNKFRQPDSWYDFNFPKSTSLDLVTVLRPTDANDFCDWLSKMHAKQGFRFRLPDVDEEKEAYNNRKIVDRDWCGCWCKNGEDYCVVGVDAERLGRVRRTIRSEILNDRLSAVMLRNKLRRAHSRVQALQVAIASTIKKNPKPLEDVLDIDLNLDGYRGILIETKLISFLIHSIRQTKNILDAVTSMKRDGDPRVSRQARKYLEALKAHLKSNQDFRKIPEIKDAESLVERYIYNRGYKRFKKQELTSLYVMFERFTNALDDVLHRIHGELEVQIRAIEFSLGEVQSYDGSHDIELVKQVFKDLWSKCKASLSGKDFVAFGTSLESLKHKELSFLRNPIITQQLQEQDMLFKTFLDRSSLKRKEIDLTALLPFCSLACSYWSILEESSRTYVHQSHIKFRTNPKVLAELDEFKMRKLRAAKAYIIILHVSLGLQEKISLFGGIRLVREKIHPQTQTQMKSA